MSLRNRLRIAQVTDNAIAERAYHLWESRGCPEGDGQDDWQVAKEQLENETRKKLRRRPLRRLIARIRNRAAL